MSRKNKAQNKIARRLERQEKSYWKDEDLIKLNPYFKPNKVCKNAIFVKEKVEGYAMEINVNKGCKNLRRNSSAWCEDCAKKYNEKT